MYLESWKATRVLDLNTAFFERTTGARELDPHEPPFGYIRPRIYSECLFTRTWWYCSYTHILEALSFDLLKRVLYCCVRKHWPLISSQPYHLDCRYYNDNCFQLPGQSWVGPVMLREKGWNSRHVQVDGKATECWLCELCGCWILIIYIWLREVENGPAADQKQEIDFV